MNTHKTFLLISIPSIVILTHIPFTTSTSWIKYIVLFSNALAFYLLTTLSLSFAADQAVISSKTNKSKSSNQWLSTSRTFGTYTALYILSIPIIFPNSDPILNCLFRITTFFYGCKILDLATRSTAPILLSEAKENEAKNINETKRDNPQMDPKTRLKYTLHLLTQTRYGSFSNIAIKPPSRRPPQTSSIYDGLPALLILPLTLIFPFIAELHLLSLLLLIHHALETLHTLLHGPTCPSGPLFHSPFSSKTLSEFWGLRWHQGAQAFLYHLGYLPGSKFLGSRAAGVLATFNLSGIWHGWCAAALVEKKEDRWIVGIGLWMVFMLQGVGCLVERVVWGKKGGWVQRIIVWMYAIEIGAIWIRMAESKRVRIDCVERILSSS